MRVLFTYNREKDTWCLLTKGKSSNNSKNPTKQYEMLVAKYGNNPTTEEAATFVDEYIAKEFNIQNSVQDFQNDWNSISLEFTKRAEAIFGVSLPNDITAYLTINSRCPYDIGNNSFFVSLQSASIRKTAMHELWHFYTWYGLGSDQEAKLGKQKYNELKEALTVLLNVECGDLLPIGTLDAGYPQHQEIRKKILDYWEKDRNMYSLWEHIID